MKISSGGGVVALELESGLISGFSFISSYFFFFSVQKRCVAVRDMSKHQAARISGWCVYVQTTSRQKEIEEEDDDNEEE